MIHNQPNSNTISELQAEIDYWKRQYEEKTFDFSGATATPDDILPGVKAWDATGTLITGAYIAPGEYGSRVIVGSLEKYQHVKFDGKEWIITNISGSTYTLMLKKMTETTVFRSDYTKYYPGSIIASKCATFQNTMSANALSVINSKTVQSVTAKVWIAQKTDITSWTDSGNPTSYDYSGIRKWTANDDVYDSVGTGNYWSSEPSSDSGTIWYISSNGTFGNFYGYPSEAFGFRPCIEVTQS